MRKYIRWKVERWKIEATSASSEKSCGHGVKFGGTNAVAIPVLVSPWSPVDVRTISQWATPLQSMGQRKIFTDIWLSHQKGIELHQKVNWLAHSAFFQWLSLTGWSGTRQQQRPVPSSLTWEVRDLWRIFSWIVISSDRRNFKEEFFLWTEPLSISL